LNQRAAERASIIAQRPTLMASALDTLRQENATALQNITGLTSTRTNYLAAQAKAKADVVGKATSDRLGFIALNHYHPGTGAVQGGYTRDPKTGAIVSTPTWLQYQSTMAGIKSKGDIAAAGNKTKATIAAASNLTKTAIANANNRTRASIADAN